MLLKMGAALTGLSEPMDLLAMGAGDVASRFQEANSNAAAIKANLADLTSHVQVIKVRLDVEVTGDDLNNLVGQAVANNGGQVPGAIG